MLHPGIYPADSLCGLAAIHGPRPPPSSGCSYLSLQFIIMRVGLMNGTSAFFGRLQERGVGRQPLRGEWQSRWPQLLTTLNDRNLILGLYWDNGKGKLKPVYYHRGCNYWENGRENGNYKAYRGYIGPHQSNTHSTMPAATCCNEIHTTKQRHSSQAVTEPCMHGPMLPLFDPLIKYTQLS